MAFGDRVRRLRLAAGWSQDELARRAGVTRQLVGAVEAGRHIPRLDAGLALARALGTSAEALALPEHTEVTGVLGPLRIGERVWLGRVGDRLVAAPVPSIGDDWAAADAIVGANGVEYLPGAELGIVLVGCEPAMGLAARLLEAHRGGRVLPVLASSEAARDALAAGRAHGAVVHGPAETLDALAAQHRATHGPLVRHRLAGWQVGLAAPPDARRTWWREVLAGRRTVIQREPGAGSQVALERAVAAAGGATPPGPRVAGHLEAARLAALEGRAAVTIEPAALAAGLAFHPLERHAAELWIALDWADHPTLVRFGDVLTSAAFQRRLAAIGGYDLSSTSRGLAS